VLCEKGTNRIPTGSAGIDQSNHRIVRIVQVVVDRDARVADDRPLEPLVVAFDIVGAAMSAGDASMA
jgi:hypothetical protein